MEHLLMKSTGGGDILSREGLAKTNNERNVKEFEFEMFADVMCGRSRRRKGIIAAAKRVPHSPITPEFLTEMSQGFERLRSLALHCTFLLPRHFRTVYLFSGTD